MYPYNQQVVRPQVKIQYKSPTIIPGQNRSPPILLQRSMQTFPLHRKVSPEKIKVGSHSSGKKKIETRVDRSIIFQQKSPSREDIEQKLKTQDQEYKLGMYAEVIQKLRSEERKNEILREKLKKYVREQLTESSPSKLQVSSPDISNRNQENITSPENEKDFDQYKSEIDFEIRHLLQVIEQLKEDKKQLEQNQSNNVNNTVESVMQNTSQNGQLYNSDLFQQNSGQIEDLLAKVKDLQTSKDRLQEENQQKDKEYSKLRDENLKLKYGQGIGEISQSNAQIEKKFMDQKASYESQLKAQKEEIEALQRSLGEAKLEILTFQAQEQPENRNQNFDIEKEEISKEYEQKLNMQKQMLEEDFADRLKQIDQENELKMENFKKQESQYFEICDNITLIEEQEIEVSKLKFQLETQQQQDFSREQSEQTQKYHERITQLEKQIEDLDSLSKQQQQQQQEQLASQEKEGILKQQSIKKEFQDKINTLEKKQAELNQSKANLEKENTILRQDNEQYVDKLKKEQEKFLENMRQIETLEGRIHIQNTKITALNDEKIEQQSKISSLENSLQRQESKEKQSSPQKSQELEDKISDLQQQNQRQEQQIANSQTENSNLKDEIEQLTKLNKQLETSIDDIRNNYQNIYASEIQDLKQELTHKQEKVDQQSSTIFKQDLKIKDLEFSLKNQNKSNDNSQNKSELSQSQKSFSKSKSKLKSSMGNIDKSQKSLSMSQRSKEDTKQLYQKLRRQSQNTAAFLSTKFDFGTTQNQQINEQLIREAHESIEKDINQQDEKKND